MQRFDPPRNNVWQSHPMRLDVAGQYVLYTDAQAALARLTDERDEAVVTAEFFKGEVKLRNRIPTTSASLADMQRAVERLTAELEAEKAKRAEMLDAETRGCAEVMQPMLRSMLSRGEAYRAILARIDQRKGAGE